MSREAFEEAAQTFVAQVAALDPSSFEGPGLGEWDLRALVGHTSRSLVTIETYLQRPVDRVDVATAPDYYRAIAPMLADANDIVERGRAAGVALGDNPAGAVAELAGRVVALVAEADPERLVATIAGGMVLREYLRTRTFELVVHGLDIARAIGAEHRPGPLALADALALAAAVAAGSEQGPPLLLALTGRSPLPDGFSVV